jgi:hypothetical protein
MRERRDGSILKWYVGDHTEARIRWFGEVDTVGDCILDPGVRRRGLQPDSSAAQVLRTDLTMCSAACGCVGFNCRSGTTPGYYALSADLQNVCVHDDRNRGTHQL